MHFKEGEIEIPESDPSDRSPTAGLLSEQTIPVGVEATLFDSYYNGCCNEIFWPLFHSMPGRSNFTHNHWKSYVIVNKLFAERTVDALEICHKKNTHPGVPIVWIHDYHLMLAANYIREKADERNLECQIAFFLHIPFPPWDIFRLCPWGDEILQGRSFVNGKNEINNFDSCHNFDNCQKIFQAVILTDVFF